eukprot:symbB.v1.2.024426.t1/scaffold2310.1/size82674/2
MMLPSIWTSPKFCRRRSRCLQRCGVAAAATWWCTPVQAYPQLAALATMRRRLAAPLPHIRKALALEAVWSYNPLLPIMPWQPLKTRVSLGIGCSKTMIAWHKRPASHKPS